MWGDIIIYLTVYSFLTLWRCFFVQKNNVKTTWTIQKLVFMALLVAMHLVLTRVLVLDLGAYRISLGSVATILSGLWLGPAAGAICGLAADLLGCFMKGYAINPLITIAAMLWGIIPGLARVLLVNKTKVYKTVVISVAVFFTSVCSSLIFTTLGLVLFNGYNLFAILPGRVVQFVMLVPIYCVVTCVMYFSPITTMIADTLKIQVLKNKVV